MKRTAVLLLVALAGCSKGSDERKAEESAAAVAPDKPEEGIRCALGGAKDAAPDCTREIAKGPDGEIWIIRHPDGSFRRFVLIDKGTRIATADGADEVKAQRVGPDLEVSVGRDRYLFAAAPDTPVPPEVPNATST